MPPQDDSDVKIFRKPEDPSDTADLLETAAFLNRQRGNGNIAMAKALGERLAMIDPESDNSFGINTLINKITPVNHSALTQAHALIVFIAQTALHKKLSTQLLSSCAVNAMYDKIIEISPDFYDGICDGAAFTFYSLSLREENISASIGENFAMLCGMEDSPEYKAFGTEIFQKADTIINQIISEYRFKSIG